MDGEKFSDGIEWHGIFRKGTENKVVVYFFGDSVKILFDCSCRDDTLMQYQSNIDSGKMDKTKELGDFVGRISRKRDCFFGGGVV